MNDIIYAGRKAAADEREIHSHKGYEIKCCSSRGELKAENQTFTFKKGDVIIIPPLIRHCYPAGADLSVILERALLPVKGVKVIPCGEGEGLTEACRQAELYFNGDFAGKQGILSALGGLIAAYASALSGSKGYSPVVSMIISDVDKSLSDSSYSLESYIRSLPLNYDYVRKLFKKEVGITPHEYLTRSRMERAKQIILSGVANEYSNYTVSQIAEMCGYSEPLYFSRVFKKYFGAAPSQAFRSEDNGE